MASFITLQPATPVLLHCSLSGTIVGNSEQSISVSNPFDGKVLARVAKCGAEEANAAVDAAAEAFPKWSSRPAAERSCLLRRWFDLIKLNADALATQLTLEQGKSLAEAKGEINYAARTC